VGQTGRGIGPSILDFHLNFDPPPSMINLVALRRFISLEALYYADSERFLHWMLMMIATDSSDARRRTHLPIFHQALTHLMVVPQTSRALLIERLTLTAELQ
jgi:hypothetical protein